MWNFFLFFPEEGKCLIITNETLPDSEKGLNHTLESKSRFFTFSMDTNLGCSPPLIDDNQKIDETNFQGEDWSLSRNTCFHGDIRLSYGLEQGTEKRN